MNKNPTAFNIYKRLTKELGLLFPLHESELVVRKNPIPNNLEFHKKKINKEELNSALNEISSTYYKLFKDLGEDKFYEYQEKKSIFSEEPREYPDRKINMSTVISILYVSGFTGDMLYKRAKKYLLEKENKNE